MGEKDVWPTEFCVAIMQIARNVSGKYVLVGKLLHGENEGERSAPRRIVCAIWRILDGARNFIVGLFHTVNSSQCNVITNRKRSNIYSRKCAACAQPRQISGELRAVNLPSLLWIFVLPQPLNASNKCGFWLCSSKSMPKVVKLVISATRRAPSSFGPRRLNIERITTEWKVPPSSVLKPVMSACAFRRLQICVRAHLPRSASLCRLLDSINPRLMSACPIARRKMKKKYTFLCSRRVFCQQNSNVM